MREKRTHLEHVALVFVGEEVRSRQRDVVFVAAMVVVDGVIA